ncbi:hypothetical protein DICPUDRAFT_150557 [Dictyostelium purpureum]|uniref:FNIP repeat-containing protein n=1 Tax=Dictyostelium purpureum TaxID=5786 RepID=F0ZGM4_DICPU|nr:uncharacterized protein DICPUDRAFT_150557 [Dictyostelium purpureum]EGC36930.1 hypothetical protein DICPUDRAFT_150557 [Dictyostelium purpureum]|eukprot:XP_003286573.1 hypothetical protein DICPUDRAFT_150557 [Dictyostelium purpureum]
MKKFDNFYKNKQLNDKNNETTNSQQSSNTNVNHSPTKQPTSVSTQLSNQYIETCTKLFFKIFRNKYLFTVIMHYVKYFQRLYRYTKTTFHFLDHYRNSNKYFLDKVNISFLETAQFLIMDISPNVSTLEINRCNIKIHNLNLPPTLKKLVLGDKIHIRSNEIELVTKFGVLVDRLFNDKSNAPIKSTFSNPHLNELVSLELGYASGLILNGGYLNQVKNLLHLTISHPITQPITQEMLPKQLESLTLNVEYRYDTIYIPPQLKTLVINHGYSFNPSILEKIPSSITKLLFYSFIYVSPTVPKNNFPNNIIDDLPNAKPFFTNGAFQSLSSLDFSSDQYPKRFNADKFPQSLTKLKLAKEYHIFSTKTGYPASLTSIECSMEQILNCKFSSPSTLLNIRIQNYESHSDNLALSLENKFNNLQSLAYKEVSFVSELPDGSFSIPKSCTNLEATGSLQQPNSVITNATSSLLHSLPKSNLKSLKLDSIHTFLLLRNILNYTTSNLLHQSNLQLLDLTFDLSRLENIEISKEFLPHKIKTLIIRGQFKVKFNQLPESLEFIYISTQNETLKDPIELNKISNLYVLFDNDCSIFNPNSKLYLNHIVFYRKSFNQYEDFYRSNEKEHLRAIRVKVPGQNNYDFIKFTENLTSNTKSLIFESGGPLTLNLKVLKFPDTLKYIKILQKILTEETYFDLVKNNLSSILMGNNRNSNLYNLNQNYGITHLEISYSDWKIISKHNYSPPNLYKLTLFDENFPIIGEGMLPENLQSLKIIPTYPHSFIQLPNQLKEIEIGIGYMSTIDNKIFYYFPPSITSIKLKSPLCKGIQPFRESLAKSLKKLVVIHDHIKPLYLNGTLESLTYLDISKSYKTINIDLLPQTLITLKLSLSATVEKTETNRGFPASITDFGGSSSHLSLKFQNPLNLQYLQITKFSTPMPQNPHYNFINFNNFPNIKSICYLHIISPSDNLNCNTITLSNETLVPSLEIVILGGSPADPTIKLPLPNSIKHIYFSSNLQPNLKEFINSTEIKHKIRFFNDLDQAKLYNKLKKIYF